MTDAGAGAASDVLFVREIDGTAPRSDVEAATSATAAVARRFVATTTGSPFVATNAGIS